MVEIVAEQAEQAVAVAQVAQMGMEPTVEQVLFYHPIMVAVAVAAAAAELRVEQGKELRAEQVEITI
jgi:hypothetical protein